MIMTGKWMVFDGAFNDKSFLIQSRDAIISILKVVISFLLHPKLVCTGGHASR
jgi:hypothetical protein